MEPDRSLSVARYETEIPLLILVIVVSITLWFFIFVSLVGIFYAVFFAVFFFLAHVAFIARLRGSSIKLGPDQMPEIYARVEAMSARMGLKGTPEAYVMQAGGILNALATKLFSANFIVLFSELLDACGDDTQAADFIIAHELGHLKAGHLRFQWLIIPGRIFPFIGSAYSRAREFTADRYGASQTTDQRAAVRGLTILAAGPKQAARVNLEAMMRQRQDMNTVLMMLGKWMATHPPVVERIAEIDRTLAPARIVAASAVLGAAAIIAFGFLLPIAGGGYLLKKFIDTAKRAAEQAQGSLPTEPATRSPKQIANVPAATEREKKELQQLADVAKRYHARTGQYPEDESALYAAYSLEHPGDADLLDPFDDERYGYFSDHDSLELWSAGSRDPWKISALKISVPDQSPKPGTAASAPRR